MGVLVTRVLQFGVSNRPPELVLHRALNSGPTIHMRIQNQEFLNRVPT